MKTTFIIIAAAVMCACAAPRMAKKANLAHAQARTSELLKMAGAPTGKDFPRTMRGEKLVTTGMRDWTSGFFPGNLWLLYELTGKPEWRAEAEKWTAPLEPLKNYTGTHDLGFMVGCSFGQGARLTGQYKNILVQAAEALITRWSPATRTIKSWNGFGSWNDEEGFEWPVIIDNMMNLELLFEASRLTGDPKFRDIAIAHADATLKNHLRDDGSSYHVVAYDPATGGVIAKRTAQGYSDESTWARGQAWALYGFTMCARETGLQRYKEAAIKAAEWYLTHLPADMVPLWDFNAGQAGFTPGPKSNAVRYVGERNKDASAAAIAASALLDLAKQTGRRDFRKKAVQTLKSLSKTPYSAPGGGFILLHSTGSIPHKVEIDVPLIYADYYYLEALTRL